MTKYFNFSTLKGKAIETINRFTLCLLFIAALTIALCTMIIADDTNAESLALLGQTSRQMTAVLLGSEQTPKY